MTDKELILVNNLIEAAKPFLSGDVVDELTTTIPLMEELEKSINELQEVILG